MADLDTHRFGGIRKQNGVRFEINVRHHTKNLGGHDGGWLAYLLGNFKACPSRTLELMEQDEDDPEQFSKSYFRHRNPVTCSGHVQPTLGGQFPHYNGGLLMAQFRHSDLERRRPGIPPALATLVSSMTKQDTELTKVNLGSSHPRRLLIQPSSMGNTISLKPL